MMVNLSQKERFLIQDLQDQEKLCIEKYSVSENMAKDIVLKNLFSSLREAEKKHYDSLGQVLNGTVPAVSSGSGGNSVSNYNPTPTYVGNFNEADKKSDNFLCTDAITVEKYVSSAYNYDLFQFGSAEVRKLLNDIQTEEQGHAEKIYKYKTVNQMV